VDEAQDVDPDIYQRRFRPMAATTNATTLICGTAWDDTDLLQTTIAENRELEQRDGIRRNFLYNAGVVGACVPAYARFVAAERARLGATHPLITTEYDLVPVAGEGKLLNAAQLAQLQGTHPRLRAPLLAQQYIAAIDLAGEDTGSGRLNDRTVLTIGRLAQQDTAQELAGLQPVDVVEHLAWRGEQHARLIPQLTDTLRRWRVRAATIDATGVGEATASLIAATVKTCAVEPFKFTQQSKSELAFSVITAVNTGALKLYAGDGSADHITCTQELTNARRETRPNKTMNFYVPEPLGNDDYIVSLALLVHCAAANPPRRARMRPSR
jgi:hypothetical protein